MMMSGNDDYLYMVTVLCPICEAVSRYVEKRDHAVPLDQDVRIAAKYCGHCGGAVDTSGGWDRHAEYKIEISPETESEGSG